VSASAHVTGMQQPSSRNTVPGSDASDGGARRRYERVHTRTSAAPRVSRRTLYASRLRRCSSEASSSTIQEQCSRYRARRRASLDPTSRCAQDRMRGRGACTISFNTGVRSDSFVIEYRCGMRGRLRLQLCRSRVPSALYLDVRLAHLARSVSCVRRTYVRPMPFHQRADLILAPCTRTFSSLLLRVTSSAAHRASV